LLVLSAISPSNTTGGWVETGMSFSPISMSSSMSSLSANMHIFYIKITGTTWITNNQKKMENLPSSWCTDEF
jgi:hypothetical protein